MAAILPPAPVGAPFTDYSWVDWYQKIQRAINDSGTVTHNATTGLQGGGGGDYYHLSAAQYSTLTTNINETIDDRVAALIQNGTGISWSYNDAGATLTPTVSLGSFSTTDLSEGSNLYYTNERVDDRVAALIQNGTGITWAYNDGAGTLTPTISFSGFTTTDLAEGTNLYFTDERVDDRVSNLLVAGANVTLTYDDVANTLTIASSGGGGGGGTWSNTTIDFGTKPVWDANFTVVDGTVSPTSKIVVVPGGPSPGRPPDDWQWDTITLAAVAGSGQFTVYANCDGPVEGIRTIYYQVF